MRVLVTGGTGFIGRALVLALRERGEETLVVSRRSEGGSVPWEAVDELVGTVDAVVHLAGEPVAEARWTPQRLARIRASRVDTAAAIARAIVRATRKPRVFVSGSAVGIYGTEGAAATPTDEGGPLGDDTLARITREWEAAADPARDAGVRVVHPRVGMVLGRGGGALAKMAIPFQWFAGGSIGRGEQWISWIHLRDAVRALLFLVDHASLAGPVNVVAPSPVTMNVFARALGHAMHRPAFFRIPAFVLRLALGDGLADVVLTGQRAVPRQLAEASFAFDFAALDAALADLFAAP